MQKKLCSFPPTLLAILTLLHSPLVLSGEVCMNCQNQAVILDGKPAHLVNGIAVLDAPAIAAKISLPKNAATPPVDSSSSGERVILDGKPAHLVNGVAVLDKVSLAPVVDAPSVTLLPKFELLDDLPTSPVKNQAYTGMVRDFEGHWFGVAGVNTKLALIPMNSPDTVMGSASNMSSIAEVVEFAIVSKTGPPVTRSFGALSMIPGVKVFELK